MLNEKQKRFAAEYVIDLNATQAALRAGYSPKTAYSQGQRLLKHAETQAEVQRLSQRIANKLEITAERVLQELAKMAYCDPRKFYNADGSLKHPMELDDDTAMALAGMEIEEAYEHFGKGQAKSIGQLKKIKIADKGQNLERLGRHLKLFTDKVEVTGLEALASELEKARLRVQQV